MSYQFQWNKHGIHHHTQHHNAVRHPAKPSINATIDPEWMNVIWASHDAFQLQIKAIQVTLQTMITALNRHSLSPQPTEPHCRTPSPASHHQHPIIPPLAHQNPSSSLIWQTYARVHIQRLLLQPYT